MKGRSMRDKINFAPRRLRPGVATTRLHRRWRPKNDEDDDFFCRAEDEIERDYSGTKRRTSPCVCACGMCAVQQDDKSGRWKHVCPSWPVSLSSHLASVDRGPCNWLCCVFIGTKWENPRWQDPKIKKRKPVNPVPSNEENVGSWGPPTPHTPLAPSAPSSATVRWQLDYSGGDDLKALKSKVESISTPRVHPQFY
jgi:hypothetical protein